MSNQFRNIVSKRIAIIPFFLGSSLAVLADPSISEFEGAFQHGQVARIIGQDFGTPSSTDLRLWDTIDNQPAYSTLTRGTAVPTDTGPWEDNGNTWSNLIVIGDESRSSLPQSSKVYQGTGKAFLGWPKAFENNRNNTLYLTWYLKPMKDPDEFGGSNKFTRIWDAPDGSGTRLAWNQVLIGGESIPNSSWANWGGNVGSWNRMEMLIDGRRGLVKAWTNGKQIHNITSFSKANVQEGLTPAQLGFDANYADRYETLRFYIDDIYVADTPARVELSSSSTWDATAGNREIQPINSWSGTNISFEVNLGNLDPGGPLYLYVIDEDERVNSQGFEVAACPKCPEPTVLEIE